MIMAAEVYASGRGLQYTVHRGSVALQLVGYGSQAISELWLLRCMPAAELKVHVQM